MLSGHRGRIRPSRDLRFHHLPPHLSRSAPQHRYQPAAPQHAAEKQRLYQGVVSEEAHRELYRVPPQERPIVEIEIVRHVQRLRDLRPRGIRAVRERHRRAAAVDRHPHHRDARRRRHRRDDDEHGEVPPHVGAGSSAPPAAAAGAIAALVAVARAAHGEDPYEPIEYRVRQAPHGHERQGPVRERHPAAASASAAHGEYLLPRIPSGGDVPQVYAVRYRDAEAERPEQYQRAPPRAEGVQPVVEAYAEDRVVVEQVLEVIPPRAVSRQVVRARCELLGDDVVGGRRRRRRRRRHAAAGVGAVRYSSDARRCCRRRWWVCHTLERR